MAESLVNLDGIFNLALEETTQLIEHGLDISDPCIVTSLGLYANKYPEIVERCNNALMEMIEKQAFTYSELITVPAEKYEDAF